MATARRTYSVPDIRSPNDPLQSLRSRNPLLPSPRLQHTLPTQSQTRNFSATMSLR
ncbi:hypothetical protein J3R83DRAFT_11052 [Lanmaoa asiatica]|nr:hypothetical protein J3R83DRAFT_11052 [Lanmaoa asiatica]